MACDNGTKWCPTPFGVKCALCKRGQAEAPGAAAPVAAAVVAAPPRIVAPRAVVAAAPVHVPPQLPAAAAAVPAVAAPALAVAAAPVAAAQQGFTAYRGDTRDIDTLRARFGGQFSAWVPLTLSQAREFVKATGRNDLRSLSFFGDIENGRICIAEDQVDTWSPGACMEWKIRSGSGNKKMCILSTELTQSCGGYANGFIHTMHFPDLRPVAWSAAMTGCNVVQRGTTPILMMDANTVDAATIMAIMSPAMMFTKEIAFFTSIPANYIIDSRAV